MDPGPHFWCDGSVSRESDLNPKIEGAPMIALNVNGTPRDLDIPDDMPLLWARVTCLTPRILRRWSRITGATDLAFKPQMRAEWKMKMWLQDHHSALPIAGHGDSR